MTNMGNAPDARPESQPTPLQQTVPLQEQGLGAPVEEKGRSFRRVPNSTVRATYTLVAGFTLAISTLAAVAAWIFVPDVDAQAFVTILTPLATVTSAAAGFYFASTQDGD